MKREAPNGYIGGESELVGSPRPYELGVKSGYELLLLGGGRGHTVTPLE